LNFKLEEPAFSTRIRKTLDGNGLAIAPAADQHCQYVAASKLSLTKKRLGVGRSAVGVPFRFEAWARNGSRLVIVLMDSGLLGLAALSPKLSGNCLLRFGHHGAVAAGL
jgi:hypothetical protein